MPRILSPLLAVLVALPLLAQPLAAIASSGWRTDTPCCCPAPADCKCPHGDRGNSADMMRRCGDAGHASAPITVVAIVPRPPPPSRVAALAQRAPIASDDESPDDVWYEPETPPF